MTTESGIIMEADDDSTYHLSEDAVSSVIAELTTTAPTEDIKNVLRTYEYGKSIRQLERDFNRHNVSQLQNTSAYLNTDTDDGTQYLKHEIINHIICRIQNLFPEKCGMCNEIYCTKKDDPSLLPCARCGQEAHAPCIFDKLGIEELLDKESVQKMINPFNLKGFFYFCDSCENTNIPKKESARKKKRAETNRNNNSNTQNNDTNEQTVDTPADTFENNRNGLDEDADAEKKDESSEVEEKSEKVCRYYKTGTCKHGVSGKNCSFAHPKPCEKLLKHGTRNPRGCNLGKNCKMFHPKMCSSSITKSQCFQKNCKLKHVKGTKRTPDGGHEGAQHDNKSNHNGKQVEKGNSTPNTTTTTNNNINNNNNNKNINTNNNNFLEEVRLLKAGMEAMEIKMATFLSQVMAAMNLPNLNGVQQTNVQMPYQAAPFQKLPILQQQQMPQQMVFPQYQTHPIPRM